MSAQSKDRSEYWRRNISIITGCLIVWALVSLGAGILFAPMLNNFNIGGYPLGFWFAHQGAIYVFIGIIFLETRGVPHLTVGSSRNHRGRIRCLLEWRALQPIGPG